MNKVLGIINKWNPVEIYPLLDDEYYSQSLKIIEALNRSSSIEILAREIYEVFKQSFGKEFTKSLNECQNIAKEIMNNNNSA